MSARNRRAFVRSSYQFELREEGVPEPGAGELQVAIAACAICGTDLSIAGKTAKDWQPFGHEVAGVVTALGDGVQGFAVGDRVALDSGAPCHACDRCRGGRPLECRQPKSYWGKQMGFADYLTTPWQCAFPAGDLPARHACLLEPLGVSIDLVTVADVGPGDRVLVIGPGPLGLLALPVCHQRGAAKVWMAGRSHSQARLEAARRLGAEVIESDRTPLEDYDFGPDGVNRILVVAPPPMLPVAARIGCRGSMIAYIGISWGPEGTISLDADAFHFKRQQLRSSMASPGTHGIEALALLGSGAFDPDIVISHDFELPEIAEAMRRNRDDKAAAKKLVMVNPQSDWR